jgi:hypothetical protein
MQNCAERASLGERGICEQEKPGVFFSPQNFHLQFFVAPARLGFTKTAPTI